MYMYSEFVLTECRPPSKGFCTEYRFASEKTGTEYRGSCLECWRGNRFGWLASALVGGALQADPVPHRVLEAEDAALLVAVQTPVLTSLVHGILDRLL